MLFIQSNMSIFHPIRSFGVRSKVCLYLKDVRYTNSSIVIDT